MGYNILVYMERAGYIGWKDQPRRSVPASSARMRWRLSLGGNMTSLLVSYSPVTVRFVLEALLPLCQKLFDRVAPRCAGLVLVPDRLGRADCGRP